MRGTPLAVNVAVSDTTALLESPATLTMPVGSTGGPPLVLTGRDTSGVASGELLADTAGN